MEHELGPEWRGYERIWEVCEAAELSRRQRECVLLWCRGLYLAQIARTLDRHATHVRRDLNVAQRRLQATLGHLRDDAYAEAATILFCFRNLRGGGSHRRWLYEDARGEVQELLRPQLVSAEDLLGAPFDRIEEALAQAKRKG